MSGDDKLFFSLLPWLLISISLAIGCFFLAPRLGKNRVLWAILALIPIFNFFVWGYAWFKINFRMLDQLEKISARLNA